MKANCIKLFKYTGFHRDMHHTLSKLTDLLSKQRKCYNENGLHKYTPSTQNSCTQTHVPTKGIKWADLFSCTKKGMNQHESFQKHRLHRDMHHTLSKLTDLLSKQRKRYSENGLHKYTQVHRTHVPKHACQPKQSSGQNYFHAQRA
jgi:hypothetical protein